MPDTFRLPRALAEELLRLAQASADEEICGLIAGVDGEARRLFPIANLAADRARFFELDPKAQIDAMRAMREADQRLVAIYHSHPHGPGTPSAADIERHAYPQALCLIIAPAPWRLRAFRIRPPETEEIAVVAGCG